MARGKRKGAIRVTLPALLAALSLILLYLSALAPTGRWALVALAGVLPAAAVASVGLGAGFSTYGATGLLALLLVPDRLNGLLYLLLFGLYPMVKSLAERFTKQPITLLLKLVFFNSSLSIFFFGLSALFLPALPTQLLGLGWAIYLAGNVAFLVYDFGFTKLISFYMARIGKAIA